MASAEVRYVAGELMAGLAAAWNRHDMHAFASLFHDDAAFVNVAGGYVRGRGEIEQVHAAGHPGPLSAQHQRRRAVGLAPAPVLVP